MCNENDEPPPAMSKDSCIKMATSQVMAEWSVYFGSGQSGPNGRTYELVHLDLFTYIA